MSLDSSAPSPPNDSFSTSARTFEPPFLAAEALFAFFGGVFDMAESMDMLSSSSDISSSSLSSLARFLEAAGLPEDFPVRVVCVSFLAAALDAAGFFGAAFAFVFFVPG